MKKVFDSPLSIVPSFTPSSSIRYARRRSAQPLSRDMVMDALIAYVCGVSRLTVTSLPLVLHQFLHRILDIFRLRQDEVLDLRSIRDKCIGRTDATDRSVEIFE